jgi:hypothetical protein
MFNREVLAKMKKGAFLVNNARGAIVEVDALKEACESGQLGGTSRVVTQLWSGDESILHPLLHSFSSNIAWLPSVQVTVVMSGTHNRHPRTTRGATCPTKP